MNQAPLYNDAITQCYIKRLRRSLVDRCPPGGGGGGGGSLALTLYSHARKSHWDRPPFQDFSPWKIPHFKDFHDENKATRSPEISREQVQKLTPQFLLCIYWIWIPTVPIYNIKWEIIVLYSQIFFSRNVGNSIKCEKNITAPPPYLRYKIITRE